MSIRIRVGHVYAWDPSRQDPENPLALVHVSSAPYELGEVDSDRPWLAYGDDWSARNGMLGVEMRGAILDAYEAAVYAGGTEWQGYADEALEFGKEALDRLAEAAAIVHVPPTEDFRLVTYRSVEIIQAYSGWLWYRRTIGDMR